MAPATENQIKTIWLEDQITYDGSQLQPEWVFTQAGSAHCPHLLIGFKGPCDVKNEFMVDNEDLEAGHSIRSDQMLHFIAFHTGDSLTQITLRQRLMILQLFEILTGTYRLALTRSGDDLFIQDGKLNISVATCSQSGGHIHTALNITNTGTPVKTACLKNAGVDARQLADLLISQYTREWQQIIHACSKVRCYNQKGLL